MNQKTFWLLFKLFTHYQTAEQIFEKKQPDDLQELKIALEETQSKFHAKLDNMEKMLKKLCDNSTCNEQNLELRISRVESRVDSRLEDDSGNKSESD